LDSTLQASYTQGRSGKGDDERWGVQGSEGAYAPFDVDGIDIALVALLLAGGVGLWFLFRSLRRWAQSPPTSPEGIQAEARLWATKNFPER